MIQSVRELIDSLLDEEADFTSVDVRRAAGAAADLAQHAASLRGVFSDLLDDGKTDITFAELQAMQDYSYEARMALNAIHRLMEFAD